MKVIQEYDDHEMYKIMGSIYEGVKRKNVDMIENEKTEISEVLDNIWKDAKKINLESAGISYVTSVGIGIVGELATNIPGTGLLTGLGFQALDRFWGETGESASEKIAKFINPNYLVTTLV